jgi:hypothetical protein
MNNLVNIIGDFTVDKHKEIISNVEVLLRQPRLKVHDIYADIDTEFSYREIFISEDYETKQIKYHVSDRGWVKDIPQAESIGDKIYSEEEIKKLKLKPL